MVLNTHLCSPLSILIFLFSTKLEKQSPLKFLKAISNFPLIIRVCPIITWYFNLRCSQMRRLPTHQYRSVFSGISNQQTGHGVRLILLLWYQSGGMGEWESETSLLPEPCSFCHTLPAAPMDLSIESASPPAQQKVCYIILHWFIHTVM